MVSVADQKNQIAQLVQLLTGRRIVFEEIDCSLEENKDARDSYFEVSKIRGNYPQVFLKQGQAVQYIGSFAEIEVRTQVLARARQCAPVDASNGLGRLTHPISCS